MSLPNSPILRLDVRTRRLEPRIALCVLGAAALAPLLYTGLDSLALFAAGVSCAALVGAGLRRAGWLGSRRSLSSVCWLSDGRWLLTDERGSTLEAMLCSNTRIGRRAAWLSWRIAGRGTMRRSLLLASADLPQGELRRLLVRLRIEGPAQREMHEAAA